MAERLIKATKNGKGVINTAFIERLNATFSKRHRLIGARLFSGEGLPKLCLLWRKGGLFDHV